MPDTPNTELPKLTGDDLTRRFVGELQAICVHHDAFLAISYERRLQDVQWGGQRHDDKHSHEDWVRYIANHTARAFGKGYRQQLVKVAALAVAAIEAHDRKAK